MKLRALVFAGIITAVTFGGNLFARAELPEGDYIYSNLCIGPFGMPIGHRILLEYRKGGSYVTGWVPTVFGLEKVTGDIGEPTEFDPKSGSLFFPYQNRNDDYEFNGIATEDHLEGIFDDNFAFEVLPRVDEVKDPVKCDSNNVPPFQ